MAGERCRLVADALHQVAVRADAVDVTVNDRKATLVELCRQMGSCDSHTDAVCKALPKRPGRDLDVFGASIFRVARRL